MKAGARQEKMKTKKISINELAAMVQCGFIDMEKRMNERFTALEYEISTIKQTMVTKDEFKEIEVHIGRIDRRLQKIEEIVVQDHYPRIRALEERVGI
jgi:cobyrinic acid a,c-diamide synthase